MEKIAECLKALSDPTRLRVIRLLERGELCVCDLMEGLDLPQSKVSRHMSFLKNSGWVTGVRRGKWVYYSLAEPEDSIQRRVLEVLREGLQQVPQAEEDYKRLCSYLETKVTESC
ncbi:MULTISPECIES: ArsR/SmtB family transcription factor [Maridesulfovibrio]|uniref:Transcriptional regulator, ArsR family n=1 Tax=Maridesulfovibrio salexigens (strain ATCC 14822 / DSM 2638 / NCIMB 8403 / VKM B-1763) TaxID=526222 RepID=C6BW57_MARSD|nr:metalloregulator ArsR/SmtB family transcription factor [Maridesulfovibrio salexigens]ACS80260.1 transcriptional regulator, ArsR family [Maridesulfovibrio salexigens DSM 2638]